MRWQWQAAATAVVMSAAALLWHNLPANTEIYAPFDVVVAAGEPATGRGITATVTGVRITPLLKPALPPQLEAAGIWVVMDATVAATVEPGLVHAQLLVGPNTYTPSDRHRPFERFGGQLQPDIEQRGAWAFDVAEETLSAADAVELRVWLGDGRLDSRLVVRIALDGPDVSRVASAELPRPVVSGV